MTAALSLMSSLRLSALALLLAGALALAAGCGGDESGAGTETQQGVSSANVPANAVAIVAGTPILRTEFERFFGQAEQAAKARNEPFPDAGSPEYLVLQNQAVDYLIQRIELEKEAKDLGIVIKDTEVQKRLDDFKQQYFQGDEKKYKKEIEAAGLSEADLLEDIRAQLISEKVFDSVTKDVAVTDEEVRAYYDDNVDQFKVPESRDVAHILVKTKKEADDIYAQLQDGASFEELAKEHSTDTASAENGGKLTDQKGSFVPEFEDVAFALETGEIGKPVKSQFGWHVIKALGDTIEATVTPFEDVEAQIKEQLLDTQRKDEMAAWLGDIRLKYEPQIGYGTGFAPPPEPPDSTGSTGATETAPATSSSGD